MLGWFLAAAEIRELGLVVKRGESIEPIIQKKKKGKMKVDIIRNTSWAAEVFELGFFFFFLIPEGISGNTETNGN